MVFVADFGWRLPHVDEAVHLETDSKVEIVRRQDAGESDNDIVDGCPVDIDQRRFPVDTKVKPPGKINTNKNARKLCD